MIRSTLSATKRTPLAPRGMVVAEHPLGAEVGAGILKRGGNAVDAAVATAFAMPVVEPFMSSLAGGGTMLVHLARRGETLCVDFNVEAPAAAHETCFELGEGVSTGLFPWRRVVDDANVFGPRSVAVPGSVAGLTLALERWGTMDLADVLQPAITLAEDGFVPDWYVALTTAIFCQELAAFPATAKNYLRDGHYIYRTPALGDGEVFRQPDLARSLRLLAKDGPAVFYTGAIAQAIHEEMWVKGGMLTKDDLARYAPRVCPALMGEYRGLELAFSPGATGGITALETLNILAQFPKARTTSTGSITWATPSASRPRGRGSSRTSTRRRRPRASSSTGRAARARRPTRGATSRAGAPPTAPRTSAPWTGSATWSPSPTRPCRCGARAWSCRTRASCSRTA
ncbi:MAG: Gamma-glutamyltransferase [Candidatus Rokubacteria bacterium]|nr:Gamma-glutamyltransferase [Candidatus Rokubacteria bacterium]